MDVSWWVEEEPWAWAVHEDRRLTLLGLYVPQPLRGQGHGTACLHAISQWWWDLFHGRLVSQGTLLEMMANQPLSKGWSPGLKYGLGLMQQRIPVEADPYNQTYTIGHGGCDYGSIALQFNGGELGDSAWITASIT